MNSVYRIKYTKENYIKDYKSYLFFSRRKKWYPIVGVFIIGVLLFFVSLFQWIDFDVKGIAFAAVVFASTLFIFEIVFIFSALKSIKNSSETIKFDYQKLIVESTQMKLFFTTIKYEPIFYSQIKECLILKNVLFIVFKSKKEWPSRINKSEINEEGFNKLIKLFKSKNIVVKFK